jgi:MFS family permease
MDATTGPATRPASTLFRARLAVSAIFFSLGAGAGIWAVYIPIVQARLAIDPGILGLALLTMALGAMTGMPASGLIVGRFGSRLPTTILAVVYPVMVAVPLLSPSVPFLFASLFATGLTMGALDVAMNTQASEVETARGAPTMSSFHAFFSLGGLVGAGAGAAAVAFGWGNGLGGAAAAALLLVLGLAAVPHLRRGTTTAPVGPTFALPKRAALGLGLLTFLSFAVEGAILDWSALYLTTVKLSGPVMAATGFAAFSVAMTAFRLLGDTVIARVGPAAVVLIGGILVASGIAAAVVAPWPLAVALGFGIVGAGAANVVPVALSAGSRIPGMQPSLGVAAVLTFGYVGFLVSPPVLGFIAHAWGLSASLALVGLMGAGIAAAARQVGR